MSERYTFNLNISNGIYYYTSSLFEKHGITHMFACRFGGISGGEFDSLNVSTKRRGRLGNFDTKENVFENYKRALGTLGYDKNCFCAAAKQVHSNNIVCVDRKFSGFGIDPEKPRMPDGDGLVYYNNSQPRAFLCVKTADCVPVLMCDKNSGSVVSLHAGWRGSVKDICGLAAELLIKNNKNADIIAAIGPCIGRECYEVGEDVYSAAQKALLNAGAGKEDTAEIVAEKYTVSGSVKYKLDISHLNALLLHLHGVPFENIHESKICTNCAKSTDGKYLFFSHRRSCGYSGTQVSIIASGTKNI